MLGNVDKQHAAVRVAQIDAQITDYKARIKVLQDKRRKFTEAHKTSPDDEN